MRHKKHWIEVRKKGERYGQVGELLETVRRVLLAEMCGNFNPFFCRYMGRTYLVNSKEGDLSDPFRREESYLDSLYIEVET